MRGNGLNLHSEYFHASKLSPIAKFNFQFFLFSFLLFFPPFTSLLLSPLLFLPLFSFLLFQAVAAPGDYECGKAGATGLFTSRGEEEEEEAGGYGANMK